jgi:hypothetical protein
MLIARDRVTSRLDEIRSLDDPDVLEMFDAITDLLEHLATKRP